MIKAQRDIWVDNVKVLSCILVSVGHFLQSMVRAYILPDTDLFYWFDQTIYYFHVPLFFICSGYLYQKYSVVNSASSWYRNVCKKGIALGIPYVVFSSVTWVLKTLFAGAVNEEVGSFFPTLLISPIAPYWFLYTLFFVFAVTPTITGPKTALAVTGLAAVLKLAGLLGMGTGIFAVDTVMEYEIWFVLGMGLSAAGLDGKLPKKSGLILGGIFLGLFLWLSNAAYVRQTAFPGSDFLLGMVACAAVILWMMAKYADGKQTRLMGYLSRYTMPIFLMHTICAACLRTILNGLLVESALIHVAVGLAGSFVGPILAADIMKYLKWPEFFLYPGKFIKMKSRRDSFV